MSEQKRVEFRGRLVSDEYSERHAHAQSITTYDNFADGVRRDRVRYGDPNDSYPGGITYATREERITARLELQPPGWQGDPDSLIEPNEVIRTDHRCADCDVDVGEFHLPGCDIERCPGCGGQAISCACYEDDEDDDEEDDDEDDDDKEDEDDP